MPGASRSLAPADSADIAPPEIRAPRLAVAAAAHRVVKLPAAVAPAPRAAVRAAPVQPAAPASPVVETTAYDRIAALSAVPLAPPPARPVEVKHDVMSDALATAMVWRGLLENYLATYWREVGLIAAMIILSGLLFWRLGERSRHADQELVLDFEALPLVDEAAAEAVDEPAPPLAARIAQLDAEIEPEGLPLPAPVAARSEAPVVGEEMLVGEALPQRHFGSLREAIEAMKADMAAADRSAVSA